MSYACTLSQYFISGTVFGIVYLEEWSVVEISLKEFCLLELILEELRLEEWSLEERRVE